MTRRNIGDYLMTVVLGGLMKVAGVTPDRHSNTSQYCLGKEKDLSSFLVAADCDGTLFNERSDIGNYTLGALVKLRRRGLKLAYATGKSPTVIEGFPRELVEEGGQAIYIAYSGAFVRCNGDPVEHALGKEAVGKIVAFFDALKDSENVRARGGITFNQYVGVGLFGEDPENIDEGRKSAVESMQAAYLDMNPGLRYSTVETGVITPTHKFMIIGSDDNLMDSVRDDLGTKAESEWKDLGISVKRTGPNFVELQSIDATKGNGLKTVMEHYGIDAKHTFVFGDAENDVDMLKATNNSFAVANALEVAIEAAQHLLPLSNKQDAVGIALTTIFSDEPIEGIPGLDQDAVLFLNSLRIYYWHMFEN